MISPAYQKTESDVIWRLPPHSGQDLYLLLLVEFQATVDPFMAIRMLQYIIQLYHSLRKQDPRMKRLPPVFPLVLYNGKAPWTAPLEFADLIYPQLTGSYIPRFAYVKLAENEFRREELLQIRNLVGALFLVETSSVADYASTVQHMVSIFEGSHPEVYKEMLRWL